MFQEIRITNFKGFREADLKLTKLNLFVGENGSGKSTIAHAFSIVKKSVGGPAINTDLPYINLGSLDRLIPPGETASIMIRVSTNTKGKKTTRGDPFLFSLKIDFDLQGLFSNSTYAEIEGGYQPIRIESTWNRYGGAAQPSVELSLKEFPEASIMFGGTNIIGNLFQVGPMTYLKRSPSPEGINRLISYLNEIAYVIPPAELRKIQVVPVFRGFLEPSYGLRPSAQQDLNVRGSILEAGASVATALAYFKPPEKAKIQEWISKVVSTKVDWLLIPGSQVGIFGSETDNYITNEGFGTNQLLFILEEIMRAEQGSLIIIEEPEIHLHPRAQFKLGQLMAQIVKEKDVQLILNTHSERVISGVLSSIRKKLIDPDNASIWLFEKKDGTNTVTRSEISEDGTTDTGLKTFMEASIAEIKEITSDN